MSTPAAAQTSTDARIGAPVWIELTTDDPVAARRFYQDLFGWTFSEPHAELGGYMFIDADGSPVGAMMSSTEMECPEGGEIPNSWDVFLAVSNADAAVEQARSAGARVLTDPHDAGEAGRFAMVLDPAGAPIGLWQAVGFSGITAADTPGHPTWFEVMSMDFDAALPFYRDTFSWDLAWLGDPEGSDGFRYVTHGDGPSAAAGLCDASAFYPASTQSFWRVYFAVADADATVTRIQQLGGRLVSETIEDSGFGRFATVADPTGARFLVNQAPREP